MSCWSKEEVVNCLGKASEEACFAVLRGAGTHGHALYFFYSTLNIWWAIRFVKPEQENVLFQWRTISPSVLGEYYENVKFNKLDLREYGQPFEGLCYDELEALDERAAEEGEGVS